MASAPASTNLPVPRALGRTARVLLAALLLSFLFQLLRSAPQFLASRPGWSLPGGGWWLAAILCLLGLPTVVNSGFGWRWGQRLQAIYLLLLLLAMAGDWIIYGRLWALPVSTLLLVLMGYVAAHLGLSLLTAGVAATPG